MRTGLLGFVTVVLALILLLVWPQSRLKPRKISDLPAPAEEVRGFISAGRKVAAIRAYRRQTGATLQEAVRVVTHHAA